MTTPAEKNRTIAETLQPERDGWMWKLSVRCFGCENTELVYTCKPMPTVWCRRCQEYVDSPLPGNLADPAYTLRLLDSFWHSKYSTPEAIRDIGIVLDRAGMVEATAIAERIRDIIFEAIKG